jgi:methyl-accepting chemotaxis protein
MTPETAGGSQTTASADGYRATIQEFIKYTPDGSTIPADTWQVRHRNILTILVAQVPLWLLLGFFEGTESVVTGATIPAIPTQFILLEVGVFLSLTALARWGRFSRRVRTALATLALVTSSAVLVHFSGGYIEAHFHFFVVMAVVAVYEDWLPFLIGFLYVGLQHAIFGLIGAEAVYNHAAGIANPMAWSGIHATFVAALALALMVQWYSTERSREEAQAQLQAAQDRSEQLAETKAEIEDAKAAAEERKAEVQRSKEHLETKATAYQTAMEAVADGDLTVRVGTDSESEAMGQVGAAFNEMVGDIEATIADIQSFATDVTEATDQASAGTAEVKETSEVVSESIQEIATGAEDQREALDDVSGEMNNLSATVEEAASSAQTVASVAEETATVARDGEETAETAIAEIETIDETMAEAVSDVEALDAKMTEIGNIVEVISKIAEQTNMLALNANIEAARAGGDGENDGFAVVADEVKQLAEETQQSAGDIGSRITEVQSQTADTVDEIHRVEQRVESATAAVAEAVEAFSTVTENVEQTNSGVQEISQAMTAQANSSEKAVSMVDDVAEISQSTADETSNVSAAAEEQSASMTQVTGNIDSISDQADRLRRLLADFQTAVEGAATMEPATVAQASADGGQPQD